MFDVVVYYSSLPRISDRNRKLEVLENFVTGVSNLGIKVKIQKEYNAIDCRLAVILGWVGTKIKGPHIQLRKQVIEKQHREHNYVMPIDSSCFKFVDTNSEFLRYSLGGVFYHTNNYANTNSSDYKWQQIKKRYNLDLKPWRSTGKHILLCLQRDGGWSMKGTDMVTWTNNSVHRLRSLTRRPILIRSHPKYPMDLKHLKTLPKIFESRNTSLEQDLQNAWAGVFYNSSSCVASILSGIPIFATDSDCVAWNIANHDLTQIENPAMPYREQWLYDLAACHWTDTDSRQGLIYNHFASYLK